MSIHDDELPYEGVLERIAVLADDLTNDPDKVRAAKVAELLDWVDAFHRAGLGRLIEMVRAWRGEIFLESVSRDEIAGVFLDAYGLGESRDVEAEAAEAVAAAMEEVRPTLESHGGWIEVESIVDGVVTVRMQGTCDGCPSSAATLTYGVEAALRDHWVNFRRLELIDAGDVDPAKADLECVTVPDDVPRRPAAPEPPLLQIRGHELS